MIVAGLSINLVFAFTHAGPAADLDRIRTGRNRRDKQPRPGAPCADRHRGTSDLLGRGKSRNLARKPRAPTILIAPGISIARTLTWSSPQCLPNAWAHPPGLNLAVKARGRRRNPCRRREVPAREPRRPRERIPAVVPHRLRPGTARTIPRGENRRFHPGTSFFNGGHSGSFKRHLGRNASREVTGQWLLNHGGARHEKENRHDSTPVIGLGRRSGNGVPLGQGPECEWGNRPTRGNFVRKYAMNLERREKFSWGGLRLMPWLRGGLAFPCWRSAT